MRRPRPPRAGPVLAAVLTLAGGCAGAQAAMPRCEPDQRLGIVAQSVPGAAYVPCVSELPPGWSFESLDVDSDGTSFTLGSDRAERPVRVELSAACDVGGATPVAPREVGVRTYQLVEAISPRYEGRFLDVFPGGCVTYDFAFARGPHIALVDELQQAVQLYSRRQLRQELEDELGVRLDP